MINYYCPEFFNLEKIYDTVLELQNKQPQIFYDGVKISKIFGSFPNMIWNGGGYNFGKHLFNEDLIDIKLRYEKRNIPLLITCTNPMLEKTDVYDRYCNNILSIFENDINEIMITSPYLEEHIRKNYPNYKINKSIIASEFDYDLNEALQKYNTVVLPRRYSKDFKYLNEQILKENRNRVEILCTDPCPTNCPFLYEHYKNYGKTQLYQNDNMNSVECPMPFRKEYPWNRDESEKITYEEIVTNYLPLGYTEFKLSGRGSIESGIKHIVKYFIKPEYQIEVIFFLLDKI